MTVAELLGNTFRAAEAMATLEQVGDSLWFAAWYTAV
jgi:hypothetical protein